MNPTSNSYESWRLFNSLDLEKPVFAQNSDNLLGRVTKLDIDTSQKNANDAALERSQAATAKKIEDYVRISHNSALFPDWSSSMPQISDHKITPSPTLHMTCKAMEAKIQDTVDDLRKGVDYNGLNIVCDFIKFCKHEREINPKVNNFELFHRFHPNSRDEAALTQGTTCVGKAWDIVKRLQEISVKGHVVLEYANSAPNEPPIHAAVAVPCKDGILLIESEHEIPIIAIKPNEPWLHPRIQDPNLKLSMEIVDVPGNYKTQTPLIVKKETFTPETTTQKNSYSQYLLRPDTDPDQSVMKRWLVSSHTWFYPVSTGARNGQERHSIQVNVAQEKITFSIGSKKFRLPLAALNQTDPTNPGTRSFDSHRLEADKSLKLSPEELEKYKEVLFGGDDLGGAFFEAFNTDKQLLLDQLFTVAAHRTLLKNLREKEP